MGYISGDADSISGDADSDDGDFRNDGGRQERSGSHHSSRPASNGGIGRFFGASSGGAGARGGDNRGRARSGPTGTGSANAHKRQKGASGHSRSGASSYGGSTLVSHYAKSGSTSLSLAPLLPPRTMQPVGGGNREDGATGRGHGASASHRPGHVDLGGPEQPHAASGGQPVSQRASWQSGAQNTEHETITGHARPAGSGAAALGTKRAFGRNFHNFPRLLPVKSLKYAFERQHEGPGFISQWREAQPLLQRCVFVQFLNRALECSVLSAPLSLTVCGTARHADMVHFRDPQPCISGIGIPSRVTT